MERTRSQIRQTRFVDADALLRLRCLLSGGRLRGFCSSMGSSSQRLGGTRGAANGFEGEVAPERATVRLDIIIQNLTGARTERVSRRRCVRTHHARESDERGKEGKSDLAVTPVKIEKKS